MKHRTAVDWLLYLVKGLISIAGMFASYICLAGMLLLVISDPIMRYIFGSPIYWSNEVSTFLMVEMALCGLALTFAKGKHVRVTLIFNKLNTNIQNVMWVVISLFTLGFSGILAYNVFILAFSSLEFDAKTETAEIATFPWQLIAALGLTIFFLALLAFTVQRVAILFRLRNEEGGEKLFS
jgi:TRAP-type C4-dicarboxylate transport system permease small subunit